MSDTYLVQKIPEINHFLVNMQLLILTYLRLLFRSYTAENCRCLASNYYLRCLHTNKLCFTNEMGNSLFFENVLRNCTTDTSELARLGCPTDIGKYMYQLEIVYPQLYHSDVTHDYFGEVLQKQQCFAAERAIRTLRNKVQKIHLNGERNFKVALQAAVDGYNKTQHSVTKIPPDLAADPENQALVVNNIENARNKILDRNYEKYHNLNNKFAIGDLVRRKLPKPPFTKESEDLFSDQIYRIDRFVHTGPIRGNRLQDLNSGVLLPGSYTPDQLLKT